MELPVKPADSADARQTHQRNCPTGGSWMFEPKRDGFRALVFRDGDEIFIQSRDEKPLGRYFPELLDPLLSQLPKRCVLDGEIVIAKDGALDFDSLQLRLHPAASRVKLLSHQYRLAHLPSYVWDDPECQWREPQSYSGAHASCQSQGHDGHLRPS